GMYHCFNIVTREQGCPEAVLIRGCELANGPGKLCRELKIDKKLNGVDLAKSKEIWVEDYGEPPGKIMKGKRIGVEYAGKWKNKMWRFWVD
ncbi:MAG: DNA-3-methyladenine glycosylase, partial [Patescibacteria group bacterium]